MNEQNQFLVIKVANGYLLSPPANIALCLDEIYCFETFGGLVNHLSIKCGEGTPGQTVEQ